jgi:DNA-binding response OmpR family regulator
MQNFILLIDDDCDELLILNEALCKSGVDNVCTWACSAEKAYMLIQQALPDFIFLDINMPTVNGFSCLRVLREMNILQDVPVIIYSSDVSEETSKRAISMGASFCIKKTGSTEILSRKLRAILTMGQQ